MRWAVPHGGAVFDVAGGAITELGAVGDLGVAGLAAQFGTKVFGRADDQRLEVVDGGGAGGDRACPGGDENSERFSCTAAARPDEMVAGEHLAGGADRVEGIALAGAPPWWAFGPADLDDAFALSDPESGEPGAVAAGSLDCPAAPLGQVVSGELKQSPIAAGVGEGFGATQGRPDGGDRCGGDRVPTR